ncbi:MAG: hypothetical protein J6T01_01760 [Kiritimatiellae bacterium]|nr:hypothetical protein [Kiritimatiellia bacterium]
MKKKFFIAAVLASVYSAVPAGEPALLIVASGPEPARAAAALRDAEGREAAFPVNGSPRRCRYGCEFGGVRHGGVTPPCFWEIISARAGTVGHGVKGWGGGFDAGHIVGGDVWSKATPWRKEPWQKGETK